MTRRAVAWEGARESDRLVVQHVGFVAHVAREFRGRGVAYEDLVAEGCLGLVRAASRYDPSTAVKFTTYAGYWVRKAILLALDRQPRTVRVPRYARLVHGVTVREISIDAPSAGAARSRVADALADRRATSALDATILNETRVRLRRHLEMLTDRERQVLAGRFGLRDGSARTLAEVGERLGLSRERIRQIESRALYRLRKALDGRSRHLGASAGGPEHPSPLDSEAIGPVAARGESA